jgi:hypothetical protein
MGWQLDDGETERVLGLDDDERYAYAINKIREHGELWILASDEGWVVSTLDDGSSTISIWPHERFAELEAVDDCEDARPLRISLARWLGARRAAWFDENDLGVSVFRAGGTVISADYATVAGELRGERRGRYPRTKPGSRRSPRRKRATRETDDLVTYINQREIDLVIGRVPEELAPRIREVFARRSSDASILGSVSTRGRRDINLSTRLPVRVSLRGYLHGGQSPDEFGAPKVGQWPPWAVRRFLLYDVLFHEIGHLQIVDPKASRVKRKFASETKAQEFADELRRTLYSTQFDHPDPIHNAPTAAELSTLDVWNRLDKSQRAHLVDDLLLFRRRDNAEMSLLEPMTSDQRAFLARVLRSRA